MREPVGHNDVAERQDVKSDDTEIVPAVRRALADRIGGERYDLWFGAATRFRASGERLVVETANAFLQDWLRKNFRRAIEAAACETLGPAASVSFEVDPTLAVRRTTNPSAVSAEVGSTGVASGPTNAALDGPTTVAAAGVAPDRGFGDSSTVEPLTMRRGADDAALRNSSRPSSTLPSSPAGSPATFRPASHLPAPRRPATFDEFVVGPTNRLAYASALGVVERLGSLSPLVVHGPHGVGKTHLLEAVAGAARRLGRDVQATMLSAEQFTSSFLEGLQGGGLPSFRRKFRELHLLVVDDLQFFAGKRATLVEFIHTVDALQRAGRQIVVSADRHPAELAFLGNELRNRLTAGLVVDLQLPDATTRVGIVAQVAKKLGLNLAADVGEYVAASFPGDPRELIGALKRLVAVSRAFDRKIDRAMAEEALEELLRNRRKTVRLTDIERAVCDVFGLEQQTLQSSRKAKDVVRPRMLAMWLARKYTRAALSEIGRYFGGRSHSTVISAQRKVTEWLTDGEASETVAGRCRFEEALRRVEASLLGTAD